MVQPPTLPGEYRSTVGKCHLRGVCYQLTCVRCLKEGRRTQYLGETSRSAWERVSEHLDSLKKTFLDPTLKEKEEAGPLLIHQWTYHKGLMPEYWAKVISKHQTAFSRQIREGILISKAGERLDVIMNSKKEVT